MKNVKTMFIISLLVAFSVFAKGPHEITGKTSLTLNRDQSVEFRMVPVKDDTKYTLVFYGQLDGVECIEDNGRMAITLQNRSNPNDKTYDFLPRMKLEFYDGDHKLIATKSQCSLPFRARHKYSVTFYPPYGGKFMRLLIQGGSNTIAFELDGMKFGKAPRQGAINVNPVTDESGLYDYSAWDRFASGASMIVKKTRQALILPMAARESDSPSSPTQSTSPIPEGNRSVMPLQSCCVFWTRTISKSRRPESMPRKKE